MVRTAFLYYLVRIDAMSVARVSARIDGREGAKSDGSSQLRLLIHAAFYERMPLQEVDGRVFLLGLRLALSLMLGHRRVLFLSGSVGRHSKRAGKQASRDDGE